MNLVLVRTIFSSFKMFIVIYLFGRVCAKTRKIFIFVQYSRKPKLCFRFYGVARTTMRIHTCKQCAKCALLYVLTEYT